MAKRSAENIERELREAKRQKEELEFLNSAGVPVDKIFAKKRSVESIERELREAKRQKEELELLNSAGAAVDKIFAKWGEKLSPLKGLEKGVYKLTIYPPPYRKRESSWAHSLQPPRGDLALNHPWSLGQYLNANVDVWLPLVFYADSQVALRPVKTDGQLLRLFGVIFFIQKSSNPFVALENNYLYPNYMPLDRRQPFDSFSHMGKRYDLGKPKDVEKLYAVALQREKDSFTAKKKIETLRKDRERINKELEEAGKLAEKLIGVYPFHII
jgi:hypothetical protein